MFIQNSPQYDFFVATPGVRYYLFGVGHTIVKVIGNGETWYMRDRIKHEWIDGYAFSFFFDDPEFDVIEINYDDSIS